MHFIRIIRCNEREKINNSNQIKGKNDMNKLIVKVEMSGNRYNALDKDGVKYTSEMGTGTRKRAYRRWYGS